VGFIMLEAQILSRLFDSVFIGAILIERYFY